MAAFVAVGLGLTLLLFLTTLLGPVFVTRSAAMFNVSVDTTVLTLFFFLFCTLYNLTLISVVFVHDRRRVKQEQEATDHSFSIMVPARSEELVIRRTLVKILSLDYPRELFEVMLIDDGSGDRTAEVGAELLERFSNLDILRIPALESGQGKSHALNTGFRYLLQKHRHSRDTWIVGVFDADGLPDRDMLKKASYQFRNPRVGALQSLVRMSNRHDFFLGLLQDIEFSTFARVSQFVRSIFKGAVALGGNGQFIRSTALESIVLENGQWWRREALTEDLDIGTRMLLKGWENEFLVTTAVSQQAVDSFGALYKQRTRWAWGTLQALSTYVLSGRLFKAKVGLVKKVDMTYYLFFILIPPVMLFCWVISFLSLTAVISTYNPFPSYFMITNGVSFFPLIGYGLLSTRNEDTRTDWPRLCCYCRREVAHGRKYCDQCGKLIETPHRKSQSILFLIPLMIITTAYTYHWVPCTVRAILHVLMRDKSRWVKTQRVDTRTKRINSSSIASTLPTSGALR